MELKMKKMVTLLVLGGVLLLNACQKPNVSTSAPYPTHSSPASSQESATPVNEQTAVSVADTPSTTNEGMVRLSMADLGKRLKISVDHIKMVKITPALWRDASLGCPKPSIDYIRVETPGYLISLEAGGKIYNYHTDEMKRVVLCDAH
jgi:hypothetical protein